MYIKSLPGRPGGPIKPGGPKETNKSMEKQKCVSVFVLA